MKTIMIPITVLLFMIIYSCEKDKSDDLSYNCSIKETSYSSNGKVLNWDKYYYKDGKTVKHEYSNGDFSQLKYDNKGNVIEISSNHYKSTYVYNSNNEMITWYKDGQLDNIRVSNYLDSLMISDYTIDKNNDTTGFSYYYYNPEKKIDSIVSSNNSIMYYYYSSEIDSAIRIDNNHVYFKRYIKYKNNMKIFEEVQMFDTSDIKTKDIISTWEYNDYLLLIKTTRLTTWSSGVIAWDETRTTYNDLNQVIKSESFDKFNLISYTNFIYDSSILTKTETFNNQNELTGYSIIENGCKDKEYTTANTAYAP